MKKIFGLLLVLGLIFTAVSMLVGCNENGVNTLGFTVTYNGNGNTGGSVPTDGVVHTRGDVITVYANTGSLVKTGYTFTGWNTQAEGTGTTYAGGETLVMGSANVILFAKWALPHAVTYDGNGNTGGSVPIDDITHLQGESVSVLCNSGSLVKTGFTFSGWNTHANGTGLPYKAGEKFTMGSAPVILYAQWL